MSHVSAGVWSHSSFQAPWSLPLLSTASASLRSKLYHYSSSEHWVKWNRNQSLWSPTDRLESHKGLLLPAWGRELGIGCFLMVMWDQGGGEARMSKNVTKFPTVLNVASSWLGISLVTVDLWLVQRAPITLF